MYLLWGTIKGCLEEGKKRLSLTLGTTGEQLIATGELYGVTICLAFLTTLPVYTCFSGISINSVPFTLKSPNLDNIRSL